MLAFEAHLSAEEGNIGLPYVSDDIGSYNGVPGNLPCGTSDYQVTPAAMASRKLPDDLYARWVQLGTFQPLDRLHSNHGNRLPWEYGPAADASATSFLQLREALNPYIYTLARHAHDTGLPITGPLYLQWPRQQAAYKHSSEYTFGPNMVVEPITTSGDPAPATVWIPRGTWIDYFTGRRFAGPRVQALSVPLSQMPVLVRAGAIVPTQPSAPFTPPGPAKALTITAFPGASGSFRLYDDQGVGFGYLRGRFAWTRISQVRHGGRTTLTIEALRGSFPAAPRARSWTVRLLGVARPRVVRVGGRIVGRWAYDATAHALTISTGRMATDQPVTIVAQ
jgi:alpha-glucosidase (family GH31 glycosyl hydrolase)